MKNYFLLLISICTVHVVLGQNTLSKKQIKAKESLLETYMDSSDYHYENGDILNSIEYSFKILEAALEINSPKYLQEGYRRVAYDYLLLRDTTAAKISFNKAKNYALESSNDTLLGIYYLDAATNAVVFDNDVNKANRFHDKSIEIFERTKDSSNLIKAYYNKILTAFENEDYEKGVVYLNKARKIERAFGNDVLLNTCLKSLKGEYYLVNNEYNLAKKELINAIEIATEHNLTYELAVAYSLLAEIYENTNQDVKLKETNKKLDSIDVILTNREKEASKSVQNASLLLNQFQKDLQAAEVKNQLKEEQFKFKNILNYILIAISLVTIALAFFFFRAYKKRKELVQQLQTKNTEYLKAKEESEKLAKAKSKFFATVSHELRTPLYGVIGLSSILLENKELKNHQEDLNSLKFSAEYLLALINDVLLINKIDAKSTDAELTIFSIRELIDKIITSLEFMKLQNKNKFVINISENTPQLVRGNVIHLSQVLMNLIGNACKFTEEGTITISVSLQEIKNKNATLTFAVEDTGIGISEKKIATIFDEFEQAESINYTYQGTGLGLPIVKRLLHAEDSEIFVESEVGKGTKFYFTIDYEVATKKPEKVVDFSMDTQRLVGKKILVVEDNRINQIVTKKILENNKLDCDVAENGKMAVNMAQKKTYDLILMDINMPIMDGIEATKVIRKYNNDVPIIALTAVEAEEIRHQIYKTGMNDIIVKPYDSEKFKKAILKNITA